MLKSSCIIIMISNESIVDLFKIYPSDIPSKPVHDICKYRYSDCRLENVDEMSAPFDTD